LAKAKNIEPCTLVMDMEGTDGREGRGNINEHTSNLKLI